MLSQYEPSVKVTIAFLKLLHVKVNDATVNETLQNHPDWPGILCISDSLRQWGVPNAAAKTAIEKMDELPCPFIAYTDHIENPFVIVTSLENDTVTVRDSNGARTEARESFIKKWSGIYLIAEPGENAGEPGFSAIKKRAQIKSLLPLLAAVFLLLLSGLYLGNTIAPLFPSVAGIYLEYSILVAGLAVAALLLWHEADNDNPLLQKVCTGMARGNCNAILSSKQAKVFNWLSWSEIGFFYFSGALLLLLFSGAPVNALYTLTVINLLALPYTVYSVYFQWRVAKQWCILCLLVQALLVAGAVNLVTNGFLTANFQFTASFAVNAALCYLLTPVLWFSVKPTIYNMVQSKTIKREYLRIKFNESIFDTLLKKQKALTEPADGLGIDLGNPAAPNSIIKVCSPYCGPCARAHPKLEALLRNNDNLKVKIIFATTGDAENPALKPVQHLLAIAGKTTDAALVKKSLDDWYLPETKNYDLFAQKYPMNGELTKQEDKIKAMEKWCSQTGIRYTPTIFVNGYQLPDAYGIEDLQYFLTE